MFSLEIKAKGWLVGDWWSLLIYEVEKLDSQFFCCVWSLRDKLILAVQCLEYIFNCGLSRNLPKTEDTSSAPCLIIDWILAGMCKALQNYFKIRSIGIVDL